MAERAHPDIPGFRRGWKLGWRMGFIPWVTRTPTPYRSELFWRYRWAGRHCRGRDVLDIPCGMGWGTSLITNARSVVGVDISTEAITEARDRYGRRHRFLTGSMAALSFRDGSFDVVSCLEGIEHVAKPLGESFLAEAARVLRPSGLLLLSSPHPREGSHSGNPHHVYEYPPGEMRALLERRFEIAQEERRPVDRLEVTYFVARRADG